MTGVRMVSDVGEASTTSLCLPSRLRFSLFLSEKSRALHSETSDFFDETLDFFVEKSDFFMDLWECRFGKRPHRVKTCGRPLFVYRDCIGGLKAFDETVEFALVVAFADGGAFVVFFLTAAECDVKLCTTVVVDEEHERDDGVARREGVAL